MTKNNTRRGFTQNKWGGPAVPDKAASKGHFAAFTLIELLVVILIIGILTAVAVPQYQKAVLKSRYSALMPITKAIAQGNEDYYLANGEYATQLPKLSIDKPEGDLSNVLVGLQSTEYFDYVLSTREGMNNNYIMYQKHSPNFADNIHCEAKTDDTQANDLCKALGGVQIGGSQTENYTSYILQGNETDGHLPIIYQGDSNIQLTALDKCVATQQNARCKSLTSFGGTCVAQTNNSCSGVFLQGSLCDATHQFSSGSCVADIFNNSTCKTNKDNTCISNFQNESECISIGGGGCSRSQFTNSTCTGKGTNACRSGIFTNSQCVGEGQGACSYFHGQQIPSFKDNSTCYGNKSETCSEGQYSNNSTCLMNDATACQSNKYSNGGGCQNGTNGTCPAGTPQPGGWDATTETYTPTGWNGGYCDPSAMVGGVCPSGSPKQGGGTWE